MPFSLSSIPHQAYQSARDLSSSAYQQIRNGISRQNPNDAALRALVHDTYQMRLPQLPVHGNSRTLQMESDPREQLLSELRTMTVFLIKPLLDSLNPFRKKIPVSALAKAHNEASKEARELIPLGLARKAKLEARKAAYCANRAEDAMSVALTHPHKSKSDQAWKDFNYLLQAGIDPQPAILSFAMRRKEALNSGQLGSLKINEPGLVAKYWTAIRDSVQNLFGKS